jgi:Flp pilus assembly CpaF family ATPase
MSTHPLLNAWYEKLFGPIMAHEDTEEIAINRAPRDASDEPASFFVRRRSTGQWHEYLYPLIDGRSLTQTDIETFAQIVSNTMGSNFNVKSSPFLFEAMPDGARLTIVSGNVSRWNLSDSTGCLLLLRQGPQAKVHANDLKLIPVDTRAADVDAALYQIPMKAQEAVRRCLTDGRGLLIGGTPASGKTTLLRLFLRCLPAHYRYACLEDTREIEFWGPRNIAFMAHPRGDEPGWDPIANVLMRSSVDVAIFGEMNGILARALHRMGTLGLKHPTTTIHEADVLSTIWKLFSLMSGTSLSEREFISLIRRLFGAVIIMEKDPSSSNRVISQLVYTDDLIGEAQTLAQLKLPTVRIPIGQLREPASAPLLTQGEGA